MRRVERCEEWRERGVAKGEGDRDVKKGEWWEGAGERGTDEKRGERQMCSGERDVKKGEREWWEEGREGR